MVYIVFQRCIFADTNIHHSETMSIFFLKKFLPGKAPVCLILFALTACGPDKEAIINEKVLERVHAFRQKKNAECSNTLLAEAEKIVDSVLLAEAKMELGDSLASLRPARPPKPAPLSPIDSLTVQPIFEPASSTRGK